MTVEVNESIAGMTIRDYLQKSLGYSGAMIKKLKFSPLGITINGEFVTVRHVLKSGEILNLKVEDEIKDVSPYLIPNNLPIEIIYEDEYITAVNKPPFMPSHTSLGHKYDTVANALAYRYADKTYVFRPVNRLDRDTSGVMITANGRDSSYKMYKLLSEGKIKKTYIAVLDGVPEKDNGTIVSYIRRKEGSVIEREECAENDGGKMAVTDFKVLVKNEKFSIVSAQPITGRTHQLRVQFAGIGCSIFGDSMYGEGSELISRQALHSYKSTFIHPYNSNEIVLTASLPNDIENLCVELFGKDTYSDNLLGGCIT